MTNNLPAEQRRQILNLDFTDPQTIDTIKATVAKGASNHELQMFLHLCSQYQLDPFRKEIWFIKYGKDPTIMTSRDGYLKIAQQSPEYEGLMSQEVRENDEFAMDPSSGTVIHRFASPISNRGQIQGAWATAFRAGVKPVSIFVNFNEYKGPDLDSYGKPTIWGKYPSSMIIKVAEAFVLKRQFGITGLVTREELDGQQEWEKGGTDPEPPLNQEPQLVPTNKDIEWMRGQLGWEPEQMAIYIKSVREKNGQPPAKWSELDHKWKIKVYELLEQRLQKQTGGQK